MRIAARQYRDVAELAEIDRKIARMPAVTSLRFERACCLEDLGWDEAAAEAYRAILAAEPTHLGARTNLGLMLHERGDLRGARDVLEPAVGHYPLAPIAHVNLAATLFESGDTASAMSHYARALELDPDDFAAHHGIALAYEALGDGSHAAQHFSRAFARRAWWTVPFTGSGTPWRVLLLVSGRGGDLVAHPFLHRETFETTMLVPEGVSPGTPLPPHDVAFNAIGDADRARVSLERACTIFAGVGDVVNDPARVLATGRVAVAERMGRLAGVVTPRMERIARASIAAERLAADGWTFPLLVRSFGHHAGRHFAYVADATALAAALDDIPGEDLLVVAFVDTRDADGCYRKYRVLFVDSAPYPVHLAIGRDWKVHYFSADMAESAAHRAEEARFLDDMRGVLGASAADALARIGRELGLDYGGIDFGFDAAGRVVVFEANATMAVYPPEPDPRWAYRQRAYDAITAAVRALLLGRRATC